MVTYSVPPAQLAPAKTPQRQLRIAAVCICLLALVCLFLPFGVKSQNVQIIQGKNGIDLVDAVQYWFGSAGSITIAGILSGSSSPSAFWLRKDYHERLLSLLTMQGKLLVVALGLGFLCTFLRQRLAGLVLALSGLAGVGNVIWLRLQVDRHLVEDGRIFCSHCSWGDALVDQTITYHVGFWGLAILFGLLFVLGVYATSHKAHGPL
jgi:hypothetical protein